MNSEDLQCWFESSVHLCGLVNTKMEVTTEEEEAHSVLLEQMNGAQYITIQRSDGDNIGKGVPVFTFQGEMGEWNGENLVVDMISGVTSDYSSGTQYYETDGFGNTNIDILNEEDRRLAAALVAVQLQQQQKQLQNHLNHVDASTIQDVTHLESLPSVNSYAIETIQEPNPPPVYESVQAFKKGNQVVKPEFVNVKCEDDVDISAESSEDTVPTTPGLKRTLPHKKRIPRKLKHQSKKNVIKKESPRSNQSATSDTVNKNQMLTFKCELCGVKLNGQFKFFEHLKSHYEPLKEETKLVNATISKSIIPLPSLQDSTGVETVIEEFSEPEDIMEGIRGVVEETGAQIDDDDEDDDQLPDSNTSSSIWTISEVPEPLEQVDVNEPISRTEEETITQKPKAKAEPTKKKKSKSKKSTDELTCPQCDRSFHHKNSLVYHMRSHSGERPHQCEICGKSFFAGSALKVHKRLHSGDKPYKCDVCGRSFRQWGDLKYHSTSLHSEQRQFQCEYCGKDFARKYSLIVHRRIHTGEKNYKCEFCNKTFRASSYLQNHRKIHTGEKPHRCDVCGKPFRVRSDMKRHLLTHSRSARQVTKNSPAQKTNENEENAEESDDKSTRAINEIVHELKYETADPNSAVIKLIRASDLEDGSNILPHVSVQTLDYATVTALTGDGATTVEVVNDKDPLENVRNGDSLNFADLQLYPINLLNQ
ncbi:GDNF-inducible zinc finger protein 1-like [Phymastichus coffea]|uniref:GDNF-inducible zinc finger protein 1-like n=1 Tax=Phymastichus coffea TaxID=108790 RepID=UPI00273AB10E|nr:GDNF-inducible zinc finger protein 1-like [Phymastichus coffea]